MFIFVGGDGAGCGSLSLLLADGEGADTGDGGFMPGMLWLCLCADAATMHPNSTLSTGKPSPALIFISLLCYGAERAERNIRLLKIAEVNSRTSKCLP